MNYNLIKAPNSAEFGSITADIFCQAISDTVLPKVILPTGETVRDFYAALRAKKPAPFIYVQLDEYKGLGSQDPKLFSNWLARDILDPLGIDQRMIFKSDAPQPDLETQRVSQWLNNSGPVDLAVIGIGSNGHVGFNEPGSHFDQSVHVQTLAAETIRANKAYWKYEGDDFPSQAYTLGIGDLRKAKKTILLVKGQEKAAILQRALLGDMTVDVPASYLQRQAGLTIVADSAALSLIG